MLQSGKVVGADETAPIRENISCRSRKGLCDCLDQGLLRSSLQWRGKFGYCFNMPSKMNWAPEEGICLLLVRSTEREVL